MKNYSQTNEQEFILSFIEKNSLYNGKLLEVGAYDGETFSNVRAIMLKYPQWSGVFVEPSSYCFSKVADLYKYEPRRATLINLAVVLENELSESPLLKFYDSPMSAISSSIKDHTLKWVGEKNSDGDLVNPREMYVGKIGLKEILEKFGPFDFINIDVEGYSANMALQDWFNPKDYGCKLICVEVDYKTNELYQKFSNQGYSLLHNTAENIIMYSL